MVAGGDSAIRVGVAGGAGPGVDTAPIEMPAAAVAGSVGNVMGIAAAAAQARSAASQSPAAGSGSGGSDGGSVAGAVIGTLLAVAVAAVLVLFALQARKRARRAARGSKLVNHRQHGITTSSAVTFVAPPAAPRVPSGRSSRGSVMMMTSAVANPLAAAAAANAARAANAGGGAVAGGASSPSSSVVSPLGVAEDLPSGFAPGVKRYSGGSPAGVPGRQQRLGAGGGGKDGFAPVGVGGANNGSGSYGGFSGPAGAPSDPAAAGGGAVSGSAAPLLSSLSFALKPGAGRSSRSVFAPQLAVGEREGGGLLSGAPASPASLAPGGAADATDASEAGNGDASASGRDHRGSFVQAPAAGPTHSRRALW